MPTRLAGEVSLFGGASMRLASRGSSYDQEAQSGRRRKKSGGAAPVDGGGPELAAALGLDNHVGARMDTARTA
jgi:hypothetical protein